MKGAFLYIDAGKGHYIPAKALYDAYIADTNEEAVLANLFDIISSKYIKSTMQNSWRYWLKHPRTQPIAYPMIDRPLERFLLRTIVNSPRHLNSLKHWVMKERPDFVVSTNFIGGLILPYAFEKLGFSIPVFQYAPDCVASPIIGVTNKMAMMYICTNIGVESVIRAGMNREKVKKSPFPLQYKIENSKRLTRKEARETLGLDDRFTICFSVGGEGICRLNIIEEIDRRKLDVTFILLGSLRGESIRELDRIKKNIEHVKIVQPGFVSNVNEYIEASNMTMGKAGANSVMESLYLKRFTLISDQLYPFEGSRPILELHDIGRVENDISKQADIIEYLYNNPKSIKDENFEKIGITFSSHEFIKMLIEDYKRIKGEEEAVKQ